ncbi:MAG: Ig-like domain-containing protein [Thermoplasmatota archaeon]
MKIKSLPLSMIVFLMLVPILSATFNVEVPAMEKTVQNTTLNNVLTLTYKGEQKYYTLEDLLAFDSITGNGGRLKVTGDVVPPYEYTGVSILTLAQEFSSMSSKYGLVALADDGYTISYTHDDILGEVMVYDMNGDEIGVGGVTMILATMENGQTAYDGSYRIAFINQDEPITFSALWAKYVVELEFIDESSDTTPPTISIQKPSNAIYFFDKQIIPYSQPFIVGGITINIDAYDESGISRVLFIINEKLKYEMVSPPYQWLWDESAIGKYTIEAVVYDNAGNIASTQREVLIINP